MNKMVSSGLLFTLLLAVVGCDNQSASTNPPAAVQEQTAQPQNNAETTPTAPEQTTQPQSNAETALTAQEQAAQPQNSAATAPAAQASLTIAHPNGETSVIKDPKRIVTMDFGSLDTLDELGLADRIIALPKGNVPDYLSEYDNEQYSNAGNMKEPDFEAIRQLNPDLIVITGRQGKSYDELTKIAPTVNLGVDAKNYLASVKHNVQTIGELFNKQADAERALSQLDNKISDAKAKANASDLNALVIMHNADKLSVANTGAYAVIIHELAGIKRADGNTEQKRQSADEAYLSQTNPDIIFIIDRSAAIGQGKFNPQLLESEGLNNVNAIKNKRVVYLTPDLWYLSGGGLESLSLQIDEAIAALN